MHIDIVPNRDSRPAYLLRESYREGDRVRKRTLANLSCLSDAQILAIRAVLRGERLHPPEELFEAIASRPHGHVQAVRVAMRRLGFEALLGARPGRATSRELLRSAPPTGSTDWPACACRPWSPRGRTHEAAR